ncbi:hypothetical protein DAI22_03g353500 [Oryza sativa Japonica Group]|nr:hypothetical protein DAI22_03g353500 [Oryza sativa Japonica Group]
MDGRMDTDGFDRKKELSLQCTHTCIFWDLKKIHACNATMQQMRCICMCQWQASKGAKHSLLHLHVTFDIGNQDSKLHHTRPVTTSMSVWTASLVLVVANHGWIDLDMPCGGL